MANGDFKELDYHRIRVALLDGQVATHTGVWVEIPGGYSRRSVSVSSLEEGVADASIDLYGSSAETKPADATDGTLIENILETEAKNYTYEHAYRWVKAKKTAGTTPIATTVTLVATRT